MRGTQNCDRQPRAVTWRDLLELSPWEVGVELLLSLPWLVGSLVCYEAGWIWAGAGCSFYFFLTGLRQSHGAQHYTLGAPRWLQDGVLAILSVLMLASMHAVQVSHLHHHRHCLGENDTEGSTARLRWWQAIAIGPLFVVRLHWNAWRIGSVAKRRWILVELLGIAAFVGSVVTVLPFVALRWHLAAMFAGECLTGFFAVWTVHHGCDSEGTLARTQRGRWITWLSYSMFFHAEHHWFPAVPTCRLARLAARIDAEMPEGGREMVIGVEKLNRKRCGWRGDRAEF